MTSAIWTPENTQRLISLWKKGRTAAWIARKLGPGVSRCAVLGKVYRLGLARGPEARRAPCGAAPGEAASGGNVCHAVGGSSVRAMIATPPGPTTTILAVGFGQCRWPYGCSGEAEFGLCGRSVARGAFCAAHAAVGYQKRSCSTESLMRLVGFD